MMAYLRDAGHISTSDCADTRELDDLLINLTQHMMSYVGWYQDYTKPVTTVRPAEWPDCDDSAGAREFWARV